MRLLTVSMGLGLLLAAADSARPQTSEIQTQVEDNLAKEKEKATQARKAAREAVTRERERQTLEELLARALKDNPDIRVAESKLREAEAELNRVRLLVTQKLVAQQRDLALQKSAVENAELAYRSVQQLAFSGAPSVEARRN